MEKKYCPYCKSEQIVEPLGFLAIQLVDGSRIVEYQCKKCCRIIRERKGGKKMKKILNTLKYKFGWKTYKDAFFWTFVSIWLFVDVIVAASHIIWDIEPDIRLFIIFGVNYGFILFFAVLNLIKCRGGKFNDWLNTKFER